MTKDDKKGEDRNLREKIDSKFKSFVGGYSGRKDFRIFELAKALESGINEWMKGSKNK